MAAPITSILDTDLYKLTMQQAVRQHFPEALVTYSFTNRGAASGVRFSRACASKIEELVHALEHVKLQPDERAFLEQRCPFLSTDYLDYLEHDFQFRPRERVHVKYVPSADDDERGQIELSVKGKWLETILYEVPLLAIVSEAYFTTDDMKWDYIGQVESARLKGLRLIEAGCVFSEFGTRRRRTQAGMDMIMRGLVEANKAAGAGKGKLMGTSNVHLAQKYGLQPIGTIAHEWIMGIAALEGYEGANGRAMDLWDQTYPSHVLGIALTDTFSTKPFFTDFVSNPERARLWRGLRQDSGDPFAFIGEARSMWQQVGVDPSERLVVFSDGLNIDKAIDLKRASDDAGIGCSFGIGTFLTNDYRKVEKPERENKGEGDPRDSALPTSKALNIVIKLYKINDQPCVKISDELTKNSGDPEAVRLVKERFGLERTEVAGPIATA